MPLPNARAYAIDGGSYQISGTVSELGVVGRYQVHLFRRGSSRLIATTWSGTDGGYVFTRISYQYQGYFTVAFDHAEPLHNAAIADMITPVPMP